MTIAIPNRAPVDNRLAHKLEVDTSRIPMQYVCHFRPMGNFIRDATFPRVTEQPLTRTSAPYCQKRHHALKYRTEVL